MARRRRLPKLDLCKLKPSRLRSMSEDQLMKVWVRLGSSTPSRTTANSLIKGLVSNLAAAKTSQRVYKGDPTQRRQAVSTYMGIVRNIEGKIRKEQAKACKR